VFSYRLVGHFDPPFETRWLQYVLCQPVRGRMRETMERLLTSRGRAIGVQTLPSRWRQKGALGETLGFVCFDHVDCETSPMYEIEDEQASAALSTFSVVRSSRFHASSTLSRRLYIC
jgi:hypothetical protein